MKIAQVIWSLATENGGPTRSTIALSKALARVGADVSVFASVPREGLNDEERLRFVFGRGTKLKTALADIKEFVLKVRPDVLHVQGMWKMPTHAANLVASKLNIPIVISPRGMLDPWALSVKKWKKRLGMLLYQKADLRRAAAFHAASESEANNIKAFGLTQPVFTIPNIVDVPESLPDKEKPSSGKKTALLLSRLHPGKGVKLLADAWRRNLDSDSAIQDWRMIVVGTNERGHGDEMEAYIKSLGMEECWEFAGEADDLSKWQYYRNADLFVLPTASENFGLSIAEALAAGVPVITTKGTPWGFIDGKCGWWINRTVEDLSHALSEAMELSEERRRTMGDEGAKIVRELYSDKAIAKRMMESYETLLCR